MSSPEVADLLLPHEGVSFLGCPPQYDFQQSMLRRRLQLFSVQIQLAASSAGMGAPPDWWLDLCPLLSTLVDLSGHHLQPYENYRTLVLGRGGPHRKTEGTRTSQWTWLMMSTWLIGQAPEYFWISIVSSIKWKYQVLHPINTGIWNNVLDSTQRVEHFLHSLPCLSHLSRYCPIYKTFHI